MVNHKDRLPEDAGEGPLMTLGSLERDVLAFMRESGEATVVVTSKAIVARRPQSLASVPVVLKRLAAKGFLNRIKDEKGLRYRITRNVDRPYRPRHDGPVWPEAGRSHGSREITTGGNSR